MKKCFRCGIEKEIGEFYYHPEMSDGHLNKCKECTKICVKINYNKNFYHYREYESDRKRRPERMVQQYEYQQRRKEVHPNKYHANKAVGNAMRDGKLKRLPCEVCGEEKSQAHHEDYDKPLDVKWLCFKHHRLAHGQLNVLALGD